jgi:hypothetical protein
LRLKCFTKCSLHHNTDTFLLHLLHSPIFIVKPLPTMKDFHGFQFQSQTSKSSSNHLYFASLNFNFESRSTPISDSVFRSSTSSDAGGFKFQQSNSPQTAEIGGAGGGTVSERKRAKQRGRGRDERKKMKVKHCIMTNKMRYIFCNKYSLSPIL